MDRSSIKSAALVDDTVTLVLHFINPFHPSYEKSKSTFMSPFEARSKMLRLFKTSIELENTYSEDMKSRPDRCHSDPDFGAFKYNSIPASFIRNFNWMSKHLKSSDKDSMKVSKYEFNLSCISAVLYILRSIGLKCDILRSRNGDELFCKVIAEENWLRDMAVGLDYHLKFNKSPADPSEKFKKVPPYGPIWLNSLETKGEDLFVHYNANSEEVKTHLSLFTFTDKYRIVTKEIINYIDIQVLKKYDILVSAFAPHEEVPLKALKQDWGNLKSIFKPQPMTQVKTYFSEQIAFYFAWMEVYKKFMKVCAIVGAIVFTCQLLAYLLDLHAHISLFLQIFFNLFLSIWGVFFDKYWARKEKILAWKWGTSHLITQEYQRDQFKGEFKKDEASGRMKIMRSKQLRDKSVKVITMGIVLFVISLLLVAVISVFQLRVYMMSHLKWKEYGAIIPAILYAIQIRIFDFIYSRIAQVFNQWENHETVKEYNNYLAIKLFLFQFINNYSGLFYIAFFKEYVEVKNCGDNGCMFDLGLQLTVIFVTNLMLNGVELGIPWLLYYIRNLREKRKYKESDSSRKDLYPIEEQAQMEPYDYATEDYLEMCIQFGFIALFGASFPLIAVLALFEIILEIRVDSWKLCNLIRRPEPIKSEEIGIWKNIIVTIAYIGVFTNSGIIIFSSGLMNDWKFEDKCIIFVILEHVLMCVIIVLKYYINDKPDKVESGRIWSKRIVMKKISRTSELKEILTPNKKIPENFEFDLSPSQINYYL